MQKNGEKRCFCPCHKHPGAYPTSKHHPCATCGHANQDGHFPESLLDGWKLTSPALSPNKIDIREFQNFGYLQEVNRQFLHPLGMALEIIIDDETGDVSLGGIWDHRDDPTGLIFDEIDPEKAARVQVAWHKNEKARIDKLGYIIQPIT